MFAMESLFPSIYSAINLSDSSKRACALFIARNPDLKKKSHGPRPTTTAQTGDRLHQTNLNR